MLSMLDDEYELNEFFSVDLVYPNELGQCPIGCTLDPSKRICRCEVADLLRPDI